jgi:hypothetical protein
MSAFNGLKLVAAKRPQAATPIVQRRNKLSNQLWEQIELARAAAEGRTYAPIKLRNVVNKVTGERTRIEAAKRVKQWWFVAENGKLVLNIRYGVRVLELAKGKSAIEMVTAADLVPTLELIKRAVEAGELDAQIDAAALKLRDGFGK